MGQIIFSKIRVLVMLLGLGDLTGNILPEAAAGGHVENLDSPTNTENRNFIPQCPAGQCQFQLVSGRRYLAQPRLNSLSIVNRMDIWTPHKHKTVCHPHQVIENSLIVDNGYDQWGCPHPDQGIDITVRDRRGLISKNIITRMRESRYADYYATLVGLQVRRGFILYHEKISPLAVFPPTLANSQRMVS
jgi:hypothetical protein